MTIFIKFIAIYILGYLVLLILNWSFFYTNKFTNIAISLELFNMLINIYSILPIFKALIALFNLVYRNKNL